MLPPWMQPEELDVRQVRDPGERMLVGHDGGSERPENICGRQIWLQMDVLHDVAVIVVVQEAI